MADNRRLKAARILQGLTQKDLAEKLEVEEITISRVETNRLTPDPDLKRRISDILRKPPYELFDN